MFYLFRWVETSIISEMLFVLVQCVEKISISALLYYRWFKSLWWCWKFTCNINKVVPIPTSFADLLGFLNALVAMAFDILEPGFQKAKSKSFQKDPPWNEQPVRSWKWTVGRRLTFLSGFRLFSRAFAVSFREFPTPQNLLVFVLLIPCSRPVGFSCLKDLQIGRKFPSRINKTRAKQNKWLKSVETLRPQGHLNQQTPSSMESILGFRLDKIRFDPCLEYIDDTLSIYQYFLYT